MRQFFFSHWLSVCFILSLDLDMKLILWELTPEENWIEMRKNLKNFLFYEKSPNTTHKQIKSCVSVFNYFRRMFCANEFGCMNKILSSPEVLDPFETKLKENESGRERESFRSITEINFQEAYICSASSSASSNVSRTLCLYFDSIVVCRSRSISVGNRNWNKFVINLIALDGTLRVPFYCVSELCGAQQVNPRIY